MHTSRKRKTERIMVPDYHCGNTNSCHRLKGSHLARRDVAVLGCGRLSPPFVLETPTPASGWSTLTYCAFSRLSRNAWPQSKSHSLRLAAAEGDCGVCSSNSPSRATPWSSGRLVASASALVETEEAFAAAVTHESVFAGWLQSPLVVGFCVEVSFLRNGHHAPKPTSRAFLDGGAPSCACVSGTSTDAGVVQAPSTVFRLRAAFGRTHGAGGCDGWLFSMPVD